MVEKGEKKDVDMSLIDFNPDNEEVFGHEDIEFLAEEMKEDGFSGVVELYEKENGRYELSAGHRRYLAAKMNGMTSIPSLIYSDTDDVTKAKRLIMKNIHNRKMTPLKWAKAIDYYDKKVLSVEKDDNGKKIYEGRKRDVLAKKFNLSPSTVHRYLALLKLIPEFKKYVDQQNFPYYNFYSITQLDEDTQKELYMRLLNMSSDGDFSAMSRSLIEQTINQLVKQKENRRMQELIKQEERESLPEIQTVQPKDDKDSTMGIQGYDDIKPLDEYLMDNDDGFIQSDFNQFANDDYEEKAQLYEENNSVNSSESPILYYISQIEEYADHLSELISNEKNLKIENINSCVKKLEDILKKLNK